MCLYLRYPCCCHHPRGRFLWEWWTDSQSGLRDDRPSLSRLVVEVTHPSGGALTEDEEERSKSNVKWVVMAPSLRKQHNRYECMYVCLYDTFLLVFVDVHLSLLLEAKCVDDSNSQSQGFPGVTVGTQGINASTCCWYMVCVVDRENRWGQNSFILIHTHTQKWTWKDHKRAFFPKQLSSLPLSLITKETLTLWVIECC